MPWDEDYAWKTLLLATDQPVPYSCPTKAPALPCFMQNKGMHLMLLPLFQVNPNLCDIK